MFRRTKKIIVDIEVSNAKIRAAKPDNQSLPMLQDDVSKAIFFNNVNNLDRLNKRTYGTLKGKALEKASKVIHKHGSINTPGIYGSISIKESDFIPSTEGK